MPAIEWRVCLAWATVQRHLRLCFKAGRAAELSSPTCCSVLPLAMTLFRLEATPSGSGLHFPMVSSGRVMPWEKCPPWCPPCISLQSGKATSCSNCEK